MNCSFDQFLWRVTLHIFISRSLLTTKRYRLIPHLHKLSTVILNAGELSPKNTSPLALRRWRGQHQRQFEYLGRFGGACLLRRWVTAFHGFRDSPPTGIDLKYAALVRLPLSLAHAPSSLPAGRVHIVLARCVAVTTLKHPYSVSSECCFFKRKNVLSFSHQVLCHLWRASLVSNGRKSTIPNEWLTLGYLFFPL